MYKKYFFAAIIVVFNICQMQAQGSALTQIKQEINAVNIAFENARNLSFDAIIKQNTDTVFGKFEENLTVAKYIMDGKKRYYKIDGNVVMQNDSMSIFINENEKEMLLSKFDNSAGVATLFPIKNFVDSLLDSMAVFYNIRLREDTLEGTKTISFVVLNDTLPVPYKKIVMTYDAESKMMKEMALTSLTYSEDLTLIRVSNPYYNATLTITIENLKFLNYPKELDEWEYVKFDPIRKTYFIADAWKEYELIIMGLESTDEWDNDVKVIKEKKSGN